LQKDREPGGDLADLPESDYQEALKAVEAEQEQIEAEIAAERERFVEAGSNAKSEEIKGQIQRLVEGNLGTEATQFALDQDLMTMDDLAGKIAGNIKPRDLGAAAQFYLPASVNEQIAAQMTDEYLLKRAEDSRSMESFSTNSAVQEKMAGIWKAAQAELQEIRQQFQTYTQELAALTKERERQDLSEDDVRAMVDREDRLSASLNPMAVSLDSFVKKYRLSARAEEIARNKVNPQFQSFQSLLRSLSEVVEDKFSSANEARQEAGMAVKYKDIIRDCESGLEEVRAGIDGQLTDGTKGEVASVNVLLAEGEKEIQQLLEQARNAVDLGDKGELITRAKTKLWEIESESRRRHEDAERKRKQSGEGFVSSYLGEEKYSPLAAAKKDRDNPLRNRILASIIEKEEKRLQPIKRELTGRALNATRIDKYLPRTLLDDKLRLMSLRIGDAEDQRNQSIRRENERQEREAVTKRGVDEAAKAEAAKKERAALVETTTTETINQVDNILDQMIPDSLANLDELLARQNTEILAGQEDITALVARRREYDQEMGKFGMFSKKRTVKVVSETTGKEETVEVTKEQLLTLALKLGEKFSEQVRLLSAKKKRWQDQTSTEYDSLLRALLQAKIDTRRKSPDIDQGRAGASIQRLNSYSEDVLRARVNEVKKKYPAIFQ
jgi:hypothetical protein